jgi:hypothetical protein
MKPLAHQPRGTMAWIRGRDEARIRAYFGSGAAWEAIGEWSTFVPPTPDRTPGLLDHGYDENKNRSRWTSDDLAGAADLRGGLLLSEEVTHGDIATPLRWSCATRHEFGGSPRLVLLAGHWCPECVRDPAGYPEQARNNRFLAQLDNPSTSLGACPDGELARPTSG